MLRIRNHNTGSGKSTVKGGELRDTTTKMFVSCMGLVRFTSLWSTTWSTRPTTGSGTSSPSLWSPQELLLVTVNKTETGMALACHVPQQTVQNYSSSHHGGRVTPWSAIKMLDGQRQRVTPLPMPNCLRRTPAEKSGRGS